jgi:hypothetical protein
VFSCRSTCRRYAGHTRALRTSLDYMFISPTALFLLVQTVPSPTHGQLTLGQKSSRLVHKDAKCVVGSV